MILNITKRIFITHSIAKWFKIIIESKVRNIELEMIMTRKILNYFIWYLKNNVRKER
jgi:hypothetical protein